MVNNRNNNISKLQEQLNNELIKNWDEIDDDIKKEVSFTSVAAKYSSENTDLKIKIDKLKQEKYELKKTLLAELATGVHDTYKNLITEKEKEITELKEKNHSHVKFILAKDEENEELKKNLEEKELLIEDLEDEIEEVKLGREANLDAIKLQENWEKREKDKLKEEIGNKQTLLKECFDEYVKKDRELRTTNKWLEESQQNLRESRKEELQKDEKIKRLEEQLFLANKPLPKRPNKIKLFGKEIKTKLCQFTQKFKLQKQTMVAQIEVPVKK